MHNKKGIRAFNYAIGQNFMSWTGLPSPGRWGGCPKFSQPIAQDKFFHYMNLFTCISTELYDN
jgi:hypothetical protein